MSDAVINKLSTIDLATLVAIIILVVLVINAVSPWITKFKNLIIKKHTKETEDEALSSMVHKDHDRIKAYEENRINDRKQSFEIQRQLTEAITNLSNKLDEYCRITDQRFKESRDREDKRVRAELKDRISQLYRTYSSAGRWTHMEKEALEDLIQEYEDAGGDNSFVHTVVQKEMYTWDLVDNYSTVHSLSD